MINADFGLLWSLLDLYRARRAFAQALGAAMEAERRLPAWRLELRVRWRYRFGPPPATEYYTVQALVERDSTATHCQPVGYRQLMTDAIRREEVEGVAVHRAELLLPRDYGAGHQDVPW